MKISPQHLKLKFPDIDPELLDKISEHSEVREIPKDEVIVRTGQHLTSAMIVLSGAVKIYREGDDGGEFLLYYFLIYTFI